MITKVIEIIALLKLLQISLNILGWIVKHHPPSPSFCFLSNEIFLSVSGEGGGGYFTFDCVFNVVLMLWFVVLFQLLDMF